MPRPERIEYENAYYHVMNRGRDRGRINLFHSTLYFQTFLQTLEEAVHRFGIIIHAYCLMTNHYHLLIQTPQANISRAMRHINGVYTQRHNRLAKSDGSIFRGRFKSILVDSDAYLLQLTRYIHLNPLETSRPMVKELLDYSWSSYPANVNGVKKPDWLECEQTYQMLGRKKRYEAYARFVAKGNKESLTCFYNRGNIASVIGDKDFIEWLKSVKIPELKLSEQIRASVPQGATIGKIVDGTYAYLNKSYDLFRLLSREQDKAISKRNIAIFICQDYGGYSLRKIADYFGLGHVGSVSRLTSIIRSELKQNKKLKCKINEICQYIVKRVT
ncbi:hypothetical protein FLL45_01685 [Aliikangiella marina]|uniref:Transposase IS200-like domain-containing protein n=1 Tax=Aliikangiella marina TaxID=1712262 RepID=A0A545THJ0_9GAMM|nr:transposase [Aliikangiella marina]TQV76697.1 hypothetical protein FLL45_01685 [Aliikangiella marina]